MIVPLASTSAVIVFPAPFSCAKFTLMLLPLNCSANVNFKSTAAFGSAATSFSVVVVLVDREPSNRLIPLKFVESAIRSISSFREAISFCRFARSTALSYVPFADWSASSTIRFSME